MSSTLYSFRNIIYTYCRRLNVNRPPFGKIINNNTRSFTVFRKSKSKTILINDQRLGARSCNLSGQPNPENQSKRSYVPLMEFPELTWPKFYQIAGCWLNFQFRVIPLEREFDIVEFRNGAIQAVCTISDALSKEDYDSLEGLVTPEAIEVIKRNISRMSDEQKRELSLKEFEFVFALPSNVGVQNIAGKSSKIVEVLMVLHFLRDWEDPQLYSKLADKDGGFEKLEAMNKVIAHPDYPNHSIVANYRFMREFGGGDDSSWSVNLVNQFRLSDVQ